MLRFLVHVLYHNWIPYPHLCNLLLFHGKKFFFNSITTLFLLYLCWLFLYVVYQNIWFYSLWYILAICLLSQVTLCAKESALISFFFFPPLFSPNRNCSPIWINWFNVIIHLTADCGKKFVCLHAGCLCWKY